MKYKMFNYPANEGQPTKKRLSGRPAPFRQGTLFYMEDKE